MSEFDLAGTVKFSVDTFPYSLVLNFSSNAIFQIEINYPNVHLLCQNHPQGFDSLTNFLNKKMVFIILLFGP
jgi:hypothetical protein